METTILPEWQLLVDSALNFEIGKTYTHDELEVVLTIKKNTQKYYNAINKAIAKLIEHGIVLRNVKNTGYKMITPDEWEQTIKDKLKKGGKCIEEAFSMVTHAPLLSMSEEKRLSCLKIHDMILKQKYMLAGGVVSIDLKEKPIKKLNGGHE